MCMLSGTGQANAEATAQAANQQTFYNDLSNAYSTQYGNQSAITSALTSAFMPTLRAGQNQYGFSPGEQAALSTQSLEGAAAANQQAQQALGTGLASRDSTGLPSGADAQISAELSNAAAQQNAQGQLGIKEAGYAQGAQNFGNAASVLGGTAQIENPLGYAALTNAANNSELGAINLNNQLNGDQWGSILGGLANIGTSLATGGVFGGGNSNSNNSVPSPADVAGGFF
jgi:hypothetical protein